MKITITDIAKKAGVSIATVSRAFNNEEEKIKPETRAHILRIAEELNYFPNSIARSLASSSTKTIGLVLPEIQGEFYTEVIKGIDEVAYSGGYHVIVASSHSQRNIVDSVMSFMGKSMVDGIILMVPSLSSKVKEILSKYITPVVIINDEEEFKDYDTVSIDNFQGAYSITNYLVQTFQHKKIAIITGPEGNNDAQRRTEGYISALKDNGIEKNNNWIIKGDFTIKGGELACSRLLSLVNKPDVIFAANDMMAVGCYRAIYSMGLKVGRDIGVAGFDHIILSDFVYPKLTTVHVPIAEVGKTAASMMLKKLTSKEEEKSRHIKISTGLIIGDSILPLSS